ncbi:MULTISPECIES: helix-turn-helix transcriptional regulator [unclassified Mesorhizobium]|uniref:helix-turn-helix domain-containing protein n=1 Tax=unclassified Mesorhizobium TaxID=325217 RepID=UPI0033351C74
MLAFHPNRDKSQSLLGLGFDYPFWHIEAMDVPVVLRALLKATGWTQARLAGRLGVNQNDISRWLKGREPRGNAMEAIRTLALEHGVLEDPTLRGSPQDPNERRLQSVFARVAAAPLLLQDRVISFAEFQLEQFERQKKSRETAT